jgi:hypothetical protein
MLRNRSFIALSTAAVFALLSNACVVRWTDEPIEDDDSSFFDDDASSVSTGVGGDDTSTGVGGDDTSSGVGGHDTSTGVGGGDPYCVDGEGTGETSAVCDDLAISLSNAGMCQDGFSPLGYAACNHAFEIWEPGFAEELAFCLSYIPTEDACDEQPVIDCVQELYTDSCDVPFIEDTCQYWADTCSDAGETLDVDQCSSDMTPFSDEGILRVSDCMNETDGTCQERYDYCFEEVTALD